MSLVDQWKYEKAYKLENYHLQGARQTEVMGDIDTMSPGLKYLDVGCGRGESIRWANQRGVIATGTEIVDYLCNENVVHADIEALPFDDNAFDYVSCYDVLEHLPPGTEQKALDELGRVCSLRLILTTNDRPSTLPTGEDLHTNKRPQHIWHADMLERWGDKAIFSTFGTYDWKWTVDLS